MRTAGRRSHEEKVARVVGQQEKTTVTVVEPRVKKVASHASRIDSDVQVARFNLCDSMRLH
jgi:hypothetical protein